MDLKEIGYFSKTHGVKGHLVLKSDKEFYYEEVNAFFVELAGNKAPYFVSEIKETNTGLTVLFEDINAIEKAKPLVGKTVFIDSKFLSEDGDNEDWVGYELIDSEFGSLGNILEVNDSGAQVLVSILYKEKEVILPLVDEFIESVDHEKKLIKFKAPEGLINLYLNDK
ncbi:MAG: ribosome maturation factor RimM [Bacteroidia bacterium]